jgi:hypothetical protein
MTKCFVPYLIGDEMLLDLNSSPPREMQEVNFSPPVEHEPIQQEAIHEEEAGK